MGVVTPFKGVTTSPLTSDEGFNTSVRNRSLKNEVRPTYMGIEAISTGVVEARCEEGRQRSEAQGRQRSEAQGRQRSEAQERQRSEAQESYKRRTRSL